MQPGSVPNPIWAEAGRLKEVEKYSITVRPFDNMSGDPELIKKLRCPPNPLADES